MNYHWIDAVGIEQGDLLVTPNAANPALVYLAKVDHSWFDYDKGWLYVYATTPKGDATSYRFTEDQTVTVLRGF